MLYMYIDIVIQTRNYRVRVRRGRGGGGRLPCNFLKIKKMQWFKKKCHDCVHLWIKFCIQNIVFRVSRRKIFKYFPGIFCVFLTKCLLNCPNFTKPTLPWKISACLPVILVWEYIWQKYNQNIYVYNAGNTLSKKLR